MIQFEHKCVKYSATYLLSSKYSNFWITGDFIVKIRKEHCDIFGDTSLEQAKYQTDSEYIRGTRFEPSIYKGVVECLNESGNPTTGLLMKFVDNSHRLDSCHTHIDSSSWILLTKKIKALINNAPIIDVYDYSSSLAAGNKRLSDNVNHKGGTQWLSLAWEMLTKQTDFLSATFEKRVASQQIKDLHGDLGFTNIYFHKTQFFSLDPCVASQDMYYIDSLYQYADFMSELIRYRRVDLFNLILNFIEHEKTYDKTLLYYYLLRHCLIRASVHFLAKEKDYLLYQSAWEEIYALSKQ